MISLFFSSLLPSPLVRNPATVACLRRRGKARYRRGKPFSFFFSFRDPPWKMSPRKILEQLVKPMSSNRRRSPLFLPLLFPPVLIFVVGLAEIGAVRSSMVDLKIEVIIKQLRVGAPSPFFPSLPLQIGDCPARTTTDNPNRFHGNRCRKGMDEVHSLPSPFPYPFLFSRLGRPDVDVINGELEHEVIEPSFFPPLPLPFQVRWFAEFVDPLIAEWEPYGTRSRL